MLQAKDADPQGMPVPSRFMAGYFRLARLVALAFFISLTIGLTAERVEAVGAEGEGWPSFNESDGCGSPWMRGPNVEGSGWLSNSIVLRGPHADYFGRSIKQVWDSLVWWDVPMSDSESLRVHERMLPGLAEVEKNLAEEVSDGHFYNIVSRYTFAYAARTIGGVYRVSQHAFGNAIDINSNTNPYSSGSLRTNMPVWFRSAWTDSGYCWGGSWISAKDAMHYNWRGPLFTPGITELEPSYPPLTSPQDFTRTMHAATVAGTMDSTVFRLLMDGDADGAIDVVNVSPTPSGGVVDVVAARGGYQGCSVSRYSIAQVPPGSVAINGDWDRDGAQDLWFVDDSNGVSVTALLRQGDFSKTDAVHLSIEPGDAYLSADHNVDGWGDLYVLRSDGSSWTVEVRDGSSRFADVLVTGSFTGSRSLIFSALDKNRDQVPDLIGVGASTSVIVDGASGFSDTAPIVGIAGDISDVAGTDFDGDGRHDLAVLTVSGLKVYAGNSPLPGLRVTSWFEFPEFKCSGTSLPYPYAGSFRDDETSVHRRDIDEIAVVGITKGCNPPLNDQFCPNRVITRGELAAFLRRALALPSGTGDHFTDDDASEFQGDIEALVAAGITSGCNPPEQTRFCPDREVTRGEMAAFLARGFGIVGGDDDYFTDDDGSVFEVNINAIASVGVTMGCNPPANDMYCPTRKVTRAEMASFMIRALRLVSS